MCLLPQPRRLHNILNTNKTAIVYDFSCDITRLVIEYLVAQITITCSTVCIALNITMIYGYYCFVMRLDNGHMIGKLMSGLAFHSRMPGLQHMCIGMIMRFNSNIKLTSSPGSSELGLGQFGQPQAQTHLAIRFLTVGESDNVHVFHGSILMIFRHLPVFIPKLFSIIFIFFPRVFKRFHPNSFNSFECSLISARLDRRGAALLLCLHPSVTISRLVQHYCQRSGCTSLPHEYT